MPSRIAEPNQDRKPWPSYFVVRTTGEIVPLIAVDELPPGTNLNNVPRALELGATKGMLNLGLQRSNGGYYKISNSSDQAQTTAISSQLKNFPAKNTHIVPAPDSAASSEDEDSDTERESTVTPSTIGVSPQTSPAKQAVPTVFSNPPTNTPLCRHWCVHGICKWGQQCRYRHVMPMTVLGLQEVGLRDWPAWYRGLNPGYFVDSKDGTPQDIGRSSGLRVTRARGVVRSKREERERSGGGDRRSVVSKAGEELGEQIRRKLKGMDKEKEIDRGAVAKTKLEQEREKERERKAAEVHAAAVERVAATTVLRWEDDESEGEEVQKEKEKERKRKSEVAVEASRKLVDI